MTELSNDREARSGRSEGPGPSGEIGGTVSHGLSAALVIGESIGEVAAQIWYHEHEQFPSHERGDCPMPSPLDAASARPPVSIARHFCEIGTSRSRGTTGPLGLSGTYVR